jgi:hypothetical protein
MDLLKIYEESQDIKKVLEVLSNEFEKQMTTSMVPARENLSDVVTLVYPLSLSPLAQRLRKVKGTGKAVSWYQLTGIGATTPSSAFAEGGLPTYAASTYVQKTTPFVSIGQLVSVTLQAIAAGKSFEDVLAAEEKNKMIKLLEDEEYYILKGNKNATPPEYDGLLHQITTNVIDKDGAALTWNDLMDACQMIYNAGGIPRLIVAGPREVRRIGELVRGMTTLTISASEQPVVNVSIAKIMTDFGVVEVLPSRYLAPEARTIGGNQVQASDLLILDHESFVVPAYGDNGNAIEIHECVPIEKVVLGQSDTTYKELIWKYSALVLRAEKYQAKIVNIGPATS